MGRGITVSLGLGLLRALFLPSFLIGDKLTSYVPSMNGEGGGALTSTDS